MSAHPMRVKVTLPIGLVVNAEVRVGKRLSRCTGPRRRQIRARDAIDGTPRGKYFAIAATTHMFRVSCTPGPGIDDLLGKVEQC